MNRWKMASVVLLVSSLVLVGCRTDDEDPAHQAHSTPSSEQTITAPGSYNSVARQSASKDGDDDASDTPALDEGNAVNVSEPTSEELAHREPDVKDTSGAQDAFRTAQQDALDPSFTQEYAFGDTLPDFDDDITIERERVIGERVAEVATSFRPGSDFSREDAMVRASSVAIEALQPESIRPYPAADASWLSAVECDADVEVFTEYQQLDDDQRVAMPVFKVISEYRWVDGDDGCDLIQPDHFYEYEFSMNSDAQLTRMHRNILHPDLIARPSGWDL